jgi:hypothetical protein
LRGKPLKSAPPEGSAITPESKVRPRKDKCILAKEFVPFGERVDGRIPRRYTSDNL